MAKEERECCRAEVSKEKEILIEKTGRIEEMKGKLVEEGEKGKGEELRMSVWEEGISIQGERRLVSRFENEGGKRKEESDRQKIEYEKTHRLLRDFPNLKVGGLLPDPEPKREGETVYETQEWTVIVFPWGQGQGKKVIRPHL